MTTDKLTPMIVDASSLLGLQAEKLSSNKQTSYRAVQKNYSLLFSRACEGGDWEQKVFDTYRQFGVQKSQAERFLELPRDQLFLELMAARNLLREWVDPYGEVTEEFFVRVDPANQLQGDLVVKVIVDGIIVPDEDYCLEVDTFFSSLAAIETWAISGVSFLGGCGVPSCCAAGYTTRNSYSYWNWFIPKSISFPDGNPTDFRLAWTDVLKAARQIIPEVEGLPEKSWLYPDLYHRLPFYRENTDRLEAFITTQAQANRKSNR